MVRMLYRSDADFYAVMGPVFGSRRIEKMTRDRFYDDEGKIWYVIEGKGAASVLGKTIKNFWAEDDQSAEEILHAMTERHKQLSGIVPRAHRTAFESRGFAVSEYRQNFMEVVYEND